MLQSKASQESAALVEDGQRVQHERTADGAVNG
jgi:hypothetical protein